MFPASKCDLTTLIRPISSLTLSPSSHYHLSLSSFSLLISTLVAAVVIAEYTVNLHSHEDLPGRKRAESPHAKSGLMSVAHLHISLRQNTSGLFCWAGIEDTVATGDKGKMKGYSEDIDILLVFVCSPSALPYYVDLTSAKAGLFSAILSAFVVQTYQMLQSSSANLMVKTRY